MSLPFGPEKHASEYFQERVDKLIRINEVRIMEILESLQYGIGYIVICFFLGVSLDFLFPKFDENKDVLLIFGEVVVQCLALILFVFYGRKLVKIMPFLFHFNRAIFGGSSVPKYRAYESTEYEGEVVIGFVLVATQTNLLKKIDLLSRQLYNLMYNQERDTIQKVEKDEKVVVKKIHEQVQKMKQ